MKKYISYIGICLAILLSGCNQEDDVFEIFASGQTWHWIGSYDTNNWEDDNKSTSSLTRSELAQITQDKENTWSVSRKTGRWKGRETRLPLPARGAQTEKTGASRYASKPTVRPADSTRRFSMKSAMPSFIGETQGISSNFSTWTKNISSSSARWIYSGTN